MKVAIRDFERRLTMRVGIMLIIAVGVLLAGLGATAAIILNRLPAVPTAPAPHAGLVVLAGERAVSEATPAFDWDLYHDRQDACREADRLAADCTRGSCDELAVRQARRACSAFTGERR